MATIRRFDDLGRIVIPKALREQAWGTSNTEGMQMDIIIQNDAVVIKKHKEEDFVEVVRCKDCVLHNKCITEDVFNMAGKTDGFCCVGKKVE